MKQISKRKKDRLQTKKHREKISDLLRKHGQHLPQSCTAKRRDSL